MPIADQDERAHHRPHHLMKERIRPEPEHHKLALSPNARLLQPPNRRSPRARQPAERAEIVLPDQRPSPQAHRRHGQGTRSMPLEPPRERIRHCSRPYHVPILPPRREEPSIERRTFVRSAPNDDLRRERSIQRLLHPPGRHPRSRNERNHLPPSMHPSIGPPRHRQPHGLLQDVLEPLDQNPLDRPHPGPPLPSPPPKQRPVISNQQPNHPLHTPTLPAQGTRQPSQNPRDRSDGNGWAGRSPQRRRGDRAKRGSPSSEDDDPPTDAVRQPLPVSRPLFRRARSAP